MRRHTGEFRPSGIPEFGERDGGCRSCSSKNFAAFGLLEFRVSLNNDGTGTDNFDQGPMTPSLERFVCSR
jgi:hypothetical protein